MGKLIFLCISEVQDTFLLGASQVLFGCDLELFDVFYQPSVKGPWPGLNHLQFNP